MKSEDLQFVEELGLSLTGEPAAGGSSAGWRVLMRDGRVLLLLRDEAGTFQSGLSLYTPLRKKAKAVVRILAKVPFGRFLLPRKTVWLRRDGPLAGLLESLEARPLGVLLGNPEQAERRGIVLCRTEDVEWQVVKLGASAVARSRVAWEADFIESLQVHTAGALALPQLAQVWREPGWAAFSAPYYREGGNVIWTLEEVSQILVSWLKGEAGGNFRADPQWDQVCGKLALGDRREAAALTLRSSLRHGDFAPWNLLDTGGRRAVAIDWETGVLEGVPGWDLLHFMVSGYHLVDRNGPEETLRLVLESLHGDTAVKHYLGACGWAGHETLLVKTYILLMEPKLEGYVEALGRVLGKKTGGMASE